MTLTADMLRIWEGLTKPQGLQGECCDMEFVGTHVAGTIGGSVFGVAKNAKLHCIKVMNDNGTGSTSAIISGINAATVQALTTAVVSMSLGGPPNNSIDNAVRFLLLTPSTPRMLSANMRSTGFQRHWPRHPFHRCGWK